MTEASDLALAATKLRPPAPPRHLVARPDLVERLDEAVAEHQVRLVLVSAPAGSGKSTLLAAWLAAAPNRPIAWVQLEPADSDPARFWTSLAAAAGRVVPELPARVLPAVEATGGDAEVVVTRIVNSLDAATEALTLVIDDYHLISSEEVHAGLERLVELAPPRTTIVVATRVDPPLRLGRLRVRQALIELRARDLRFDRDEAAQLLAPSAELSDEQVGELCDRTEGWAAGLVLAGLSLRSTADRAGFVERFQGTHQIVADYLADELLGGLGAVDRHRMLQTSILERLAGPLVDEVCDTADGAAWLAELAAGNQLIIGLDATGTWFRYHHLLRDLLRLEAERSIAAELPDLHARAAAWCEAHGEVNEAIEHTLAAGDLVRAADLVAGHGTELLNAGQFATLLRYLDALGSTVDDHLGCAALAGWLHLSQGRWIEAIRCLERTRALGATDGSNPAAAALAITFELTTGNVGAALDAARRVRDAGHATATAQIAMMVGAAFTLAGLPDDAAGPLITADELAEHQPDHYAAVVVPVYQAMNAIDAGDRTLVRERAERSIALAEAFGNGDAPLACFAYSLLGRAGGSDRTSADLVRRGAELAARSPANLFLAYAEACAADVLCAAGEPDGLTHLAAARTIVDASPDPGMVGTYLARIESRHQIERTQVRSDALIDDLTDRELALLRYLPTALSQREIAAELYVSLNTVKTHARGLYRKLGVTGRQPAVQRARELGLL